MVYHVSDTLSQVHFRINTAELTYALVKDDAPREAAIRFHYEVFSATKVAKYWTALP